MIADTHTRKDTRMHIQHNTTRYILPACELSQTNTRWLFCSWMGRPVSAAGGQGRGGGSGSGSRHAGGAPTWPRGLPVCALPPRPLSARHKSLSLGLRQQKDFLSPPLSVKMYCSVYSTTERTAHTHNADLLYSVGWLKEGFHVT